MSSGHPVSGRCGAHPMACPMSARRKVFNDQVAVPSRSRSGGRRNSARIRSRSSGPYWIGGRPSCLPFHRRQADLVEPRYPRGDGVAQGTPDEFGGVRIRAAIADREQRARAPPITLEHCGCAPIAPVTGVLSS